MPRKPNESENHLVNGKLPAEKAIGYIQTFLRTIYDTRRN